METNKCYIILVPTNHEYADPITIDLGGAPGKQPHSCMLMRLKVTCEMGGALNHVTVQ